MLVGRWVDHLLRIFKVTYFRYPLEFHHITGADIPMEPANRM